MLNFRLVLMVLPPCGILPKVNLNILKINKGESYVKNHLLKNSGFLRENQPVISTCLLTLPLRGTIEK
jgi:hypothetical protein